jgi:serine/threonine protein kinase
MTSGQTEAPTDAAHRLQEGTLVAGRYRVVRFIAAGGMGLVYEVQDEELNERVALKMIREERRVAATETLFRREIALSRQVTHPNVGRMFDVGHERTPDGRDHLFLTMELLVGKTLAERIQEEGALPIAEATEIVRQIASALTAAHHAGIVHRDLKSANVILVPREHGVRAVVTDFGLAYAARTGDDASLTGAGTMLGTPSYMAPEQVEEGPVTLQTDLYALGIVMYEMATGTLPFEGHSALAIASRRLTTKPQSPRERRPELPTRWELAIMACLERAPSKRPHDAREVLALIFGDEARQHLA